ncbi:MAG: DUF3833 family protein, partial [Marivivens sp.]|nr:DUF3833 family protein [Marivivens sp.]
MRRAILTLTGLIGLAACTGKPSFDDPVISDHEFELQEYFSGRTVAYGQFQDVFGTVRRSFTV